MCFIVPYEQKTIFSTSGQSKQINELILKFVNKESTITDATACIGGNSIFFCKDFKFVNCIEIDNKISDILKLNLKIYDNYNIFNCSFNLLKYIIKQDVIFFDPPWGGHGYKNKKNIDLFLDKINILDIINTLYNNCSLIVLKVPNNFNFEKINHYFWHNKIFDITHNNLKIYKVIIFYKPI